jgi:hypothetical protein
MKAGLVCPYSWDVPGGAQEHIRDLAEALMDLWGSAPGISRLVEVHFRELVTRRTFINRVADAIACPASAAEPTPGQA